MKVDYIIVGQGLAGSAVAFQLLQRDKKILVIDQPAKNNSSRIAAGLFNPITGQNWVKTWLADQVFPYLIDFYTRAEEKSNGKFFFPLPLYRPFTSIEEQNEWMGRSTDPAYSPYVESIFTQPTYAGLNDPFGGLLLRRCGYLDTTKYIEAIGILIRQNNTLIQDDFNEDALTIKDNSVSYLGYEASKIIFCNGVHNNKWFEGLPIKHSKGETLSISTNFDSRWIINRGIYIVPGQTPETFRVGATYNFHDKAPGITQQGREELESKIKELVKVPYFVLSHQWGVRPTVHDRKPILGAHKHLKPLIIFNGLGTKGVSLAPYFSEVLVRWLENDGSLNKEVDIDRFKSLYSNSSK